MKYMKALITTMACLLGSSVAAQETIATSLFQTSLSDLQDREGMMVIVDYPPGVASAQHRTEPAKILVFFIKREGTPVTVPVR